ncbi:unnamed protein product [Cunninghamella echinulata]
MYYHVRFDLLVDLVLCVLYLLEIKQQPSYETYLSPKWLFKWRSHHIWVFCKLLSYWNLLSFSIRLFMAKRVTNVLFSFRGMIELTTTIPFILSQFIVHGQYLYVPYFLRSWVLILRIKSAMKIKMNLQMTDKLIDPMQTRLIHLMSTLAALLYNGVAAFHYSETTFGTRWYTLLESLYVVTVTLSTVGYGDITPTTSSGRTVIILFIGISLSVMPGLIADLMETIKKKNDGGGHVQKSAVPFILIIGSFIPEQVNDILDGFLNKENSENHLSVVFLAINSLTEELKLLERNSIWGHRIQILQASTLSNDTLKRVKARYAKAIFTMSDDCSTDPGKEDERNTARLWALYCYTARYNIPIYSYNLAPSTAIYQKVAQEIICVDEFKQYLLAMNCKHRGLSTLVINLLHQRQPRNNYNEPWQAQYDDGLCNEIYMATAAKSVVGLSFNRAAWILFHECQVILFAIKVNDQDESKCNILLNPTNYIIKSTDICVYIAESPKEIKDINNLNCMYIWQQQRTMNNSNLDHDFNVPLKVQPLPNKVFQSTISSTSFKKSTVQEYRLSRLPTNRHGLLMGSRSLVAQLGKSNTEIDTTSAFLPLCYLMDEPSQLETIVFDSVDHLDGHILVCLHNEVNNLFKFICNLRTYHTNHDQLQDIVLLCSVLPNENFFQSINRFPRIYFMEGDFRQPYDLLRAGVSRAKQIVIMNEREGQDFHKGNSDSAAIMGSHIVDLLLQERRKESYTVINLVEKSNINYIHLLQGKDVAEEVDVIYSPVYAAGDVVADSLISNVLLSQTYYKPDIVNIIKALIGMPKPYYTTPIQFNHFSFSPNNVKQDSNYNSHSQYSTTNSSRSSINTVTSKSSPSPSLSYNNSDHNYDNYKNILMDLPSETYLTSIALPSAFIGQTFVRLYELFLLKHGILCIGLLRSPDLQLRNELPFVYTNPVPSLILKSTDFVYILTPEGWKL